MITLSEAFRLCGIKDETVYLLHKGGKWTEDKCFWSGSLVKLIDMKKLHVIKIMPRFEHYGSGYQGFLFVVKDLSKEQIEQLYYETLRRYR